MVMYTQFKGRYGSRPAQRETPNKEAKMDKAVIKDTERGEELTLAISA